MKSRIWRLTILCIFAGLVQTSAQSLEQMISQVKHDHGLAFNPPDAQQSAIQHNIHLQNRQREADLVSHDIRYNPQVSKFVSSHILQIAHNISMQNPDVMVKNNILAPVSIAGALALLLLGSNGQTFQELLHVFGFDQDPTLRPYRIHEEFGLLIEDLLSDIPNPARPRQLNPWKYMSKQSDFRGRNENSLSPSQNHVVSVANALFTQREFRLRHNYQAAVRGIYRSEIIPLDFRTKLDEAKMFMNDWVKEKTHGKIQQIVGPELDINTNLVIASTLYFKALWEETFIEGATNKKNFFPDGLKGTPITVDMMAHGGEFPFYDAKEYDCRILGFPYRGNKTTMYIILPNNSNRYRLRQVQSFLTPDRIEEMISKMTYKTAVILFPKLHIQNSVDLKDAFANMGLRSLFDPARSDLSLISSGWVQTFNHIKGQSSQAFARPPITTNPKIPVFQPDYFQDQPVASNNFQAPIDNNAQPDYYQPQQSGLHNELIFSRFGAEDDDEMKEMQSDQPEATETTVETNSPDQSTTHEPVTNTTSERKKRAVTYKVESGHKKESPPLRYKDFVLGKRIVKEKKEKKSSRTRRQTYDPSYDLKQLDLVRNKPSVQNPGLFADAIVHKIDLTINEQGTEGGAATAVYLTRTGTDVVFRVETPFLVLIRHDATKLPLFYGAVNEPTV